MRELAPAGCEKIFQEQVSSVAERKQLHAAMDYVRENDIFVVTKLDRLARSVADLMIIIQALEPHGSASASSISTRRLATWTGKASWAASAPRRT